jgi:O-antigen ligase
MKAPSATGFPMLLRSRGAIFKPLAASVVPKAVIRYVYYAFVFSLPFEEAVGGLSRLGMLLFGSTICQPRLFLKSAPKAFWCFVIHLFVVASLGLYMILATQQDTEFTSELITQLFRSSQLLVFFLIAYRLMIFESIANRSLLIFALSCLLFAILELSGFISAEIGDIGQERLTTSFGDNPNVVASLLSIGLLCLVAFAHGRKEPSIKLRLLAWVSSAFLLIVIVRTGSRGTQIALALALIALLVRPASIPQKVKTAFFVVAVIASLGWGIYHIAAVRERWLNTYYEGDVAGRDVLVPVAWEMFLERPIIGWGPVNVYREMSTRMPEPNYTDPHNVYLWLLGETGLLGTTPFLIGLWFCWRSAWKARGGAHGSLPFALVLFTLANSMKGTYLFFKIFWLMLAYALASGTYNVARPQVHLQSVRSRKTTPLRSVPQVFS